jgi:hypothetical protein
MGSMMSSDMAVVKEAGSWSRQTALTRRVWISHEGTCFFAASPWQPSPRQVPGMTLSTPAGSRSFSCSDPDAKNVSYADTSLCTNEVW